MKASVPKTNDQHLGSTFPVLNLEQRTYDYNRGTPSVELGHKRLPGLSADAAALLFLLLVLVFFAMVVQVLDSRRRERVSCALAAARK